MKAFRAKEKARDRIAKIKHMPATLCLKGGHMAIVHRIHLVEFICPECRGDEAVEMPLYVEQPDMPFLDWLYQQRGRQDEVGRFADAVAEASRRPQGSPRSWWEYIRALGFTEDDPLWVMGFDAVDEYYQSVVLA